MSLNNAIFVPKICIYETKTRNRSNLISLLIYYIFERTVYKIGYNATYLYENTVEILMIKLPY